MTKYEQIMYERDIPGIREALENIAKSLKNIEKTIIVSDPGDEVEHLYEKVYAYDRDGKQYIKIDSPYDHSAMD